MFCIQLTVIVSYIQFYFGEKRKKKKDGKIWKEEKEFLLPAIVPTFIDFIP